MDNTAEHNSLAALAKNVGCNSVPQSWQASWAESLCTYAEGDFSFLEAEYFADINKKWLHLEEDALSAIIASGKKIAEQDDLRLLARHCKNLLFCTKEPPADCEHWPLPESAMGKLAPLFYAVVLLSEVPSLALKHGKNGIPAQVTTDTLKDIDIWLRDYKEKHGVWGLKQTPWLMNHFKENLYRVGRLQFQPYQFTGNVRVFKSLDSGELCVFSEADVEFRADGQVNGTNDIFDTECVWKPILEITEEAITGNPILPDGTIIRKPHRIYANRWIPALSKGDPILNVHIPADGRMAYDDCIESFNAAAKFFPKYLPHIPFKGFACNSWLLGPRLGRLLPDTSNIARFQHAFHLYPIQGSDRSTFERVFGTKPADLAQAPRDTLLRRVILDYVLSGNHLSSGAGFRLL